MVGLMINSSFNLRYRSNTGEQKQVRGMCFKSLSDGPWHGYHIICNSVPGAETFHQTSEGDEDEEHCDLLHRICMSHR